jgi:hypothetical protein
MRVVVLIETLNPLTFSLVKIIHLLRLVTSVLSRMYMIKQMYQRKVRAHRPIIIVHTMELVYTIIPTTVYIAGNIFEGENLVVWDLSHLQKISPQIYNYAPPTYIIDLAFRESFLRSTKVFSLKCFPLYGINHQIYPKMPCASCLDTSHETLCKPIRVQGCMYVAQGQGWFTSP